MRTRIRGQVLTTLAVLVLLAAAGACGRAGGGAGGDEETEPRVYIGRSKSGFMGAGGEHTGWMLLRDRKEGADLEADVSGVLARAKELDGTKVKAIGTIYEKAYVERGTVQILKIESL